jgi:hypothetical protein
MWLRRNQERDLRSLLSRIEAVSKPTADIIAELLEHACPRLQATHKLTTPVSRLVEAEAWVDLGFWLVGWELPDWVIHHLSCDDRRWNCAICVRGLAINWVEDVAEFQHDDPALAVLGALVQAQLQKIQGSTLSNVTPFRRIRRPGANRLSRDTER